MSERKKRINVGPSSDDYNYSIDSNFMQISKILQTSIKLMTYSCLRKKVLFQCRYTYTLTTVCCNDDAMILKEVIIYITEIMFTKKTGFITTATGYLGDMKRSHTHTHRHILFCKSSS